MPTAGPIEGRVAPNILAKRFLSCGLHGRRSPFRARCKGAGKSAAGRTDLKSLAPRA